MVRSRRKPNRCSNRIALKRRVGSSWKLPACSTRIVRARRSRCPPYGVEHATELPRIELHRYGIDREVPPVEILFDRRRLNRRQDSGLRVGLSPGRRDIHLEPVLEDSSRAVANRSNTASPAPYRSATSRAKAIPSPSTVRSRSQFSRLQQEIADDSADEVQGHPIPHPRGSQAHEEEKDAPEETTQQIVLGYHDRFTGTPL